MDGTITKGTTVRAAGLFLAWALLAVLAGACTPVGDAAPVAGFDVSSATIVTGADGSSMGSVAFPVSCGEEAARSVRRGLALLHNMTYTEAEVAFGDALDREPDCTMAYWGVAMTYVHPLWPDVPSEQKLEQGWQMLQRARVRGFATPREEAYVEALEAYYRDGAQRDEPTRLASYADAWAEVAARHPGDPEAALFAALSVIAVTAGKPDAVERRLEAGLMAERVLEEIPDHPGAHHYVIHAYDIPVAAERALAAARSYGKVAPDNSHALHMTSHIFTRRGLWKESIDYNRRAADAAWSAPIGGRISYHHLHAVDYLAYAHLQLGEDAEARALLEHVASLDRPAVDHPVSAYAFAAVPARLALELRAWNRAAGLSARIPSDLSWDRYPHLEAITVFANALGAARSGDPEAARRAAERLARLAEGAESLPESYDWATQVRIQEMAARAWIERAEGRTGEALALMREAADLEAGSEKSPVTPGEVLPARELLGDMLAEEGRWEEALAAYEAGMERSPNRFHSVYGAAVAAESLGRAAEAARYYTVLIDLAGGSETRVAELDRARAYLARP